MTPHALIAMPSDTLGDGRAVHGYARPAAPFMPRQVFLFSGSMVVEVQHHGGRMSWIGTRSR